MAIVPFAGPKPTAGRRRVIKPVPSRHGGVLISAERICELDAEVLVERLSERFIRRIRLMSDEQLVLLELLATAVDWSEADDPTVQAARVIALKRRRRPGGAA